VQNAAGLAGFQILSQHSKRQADNKLFGGGSFVRQKMQFARLCQLLATLALFGCRSNNRIEARPNFEGRIAGLSFESGAGTPGGLVRFTIRNDHVKGIPPEAYIRVDSITHFKLGPGAAVDWANSGLPDLRSAYVRVWFHADRHISVTANEIFGTARLVAIDSTPLAKAVR
jgi:hypothetical protein